MNASRRLRRRARIVLSLVSAVVFFGLGIAVGESLHDNPQPGGTQTLIRTLTPLGLAPAPGPAVTVTTQKP